MSSTYLATCESSSTSKVPPDTTAIWPAACTERTKPAWVGEPVDIPRFRLQAAQLGANDLARVD